MIETVPAPFGRRTRQRRDGRLPRAGTRRRLRRRAARPRSGRYPTGQRRGRRHRRRGGSPAARARIDAGPRRSSAHGRRCRREPPQAERRVRARLAVVRGTPDHVTALVDASEASFRSFAQSRLESGDSSIVQSATRPDARPVDALAMFSVATVFLLLASLVGAAGFAVVAQRRLRQLGILAATGATPKHVRLVLCGQRCRRRRARRTRRNDRGHRRVGDRRADARVRDRPSRRHTERALGIGRDDRVPRSRRRDRSCLVARQSCRRAFP